MSLMIASIQASCCMHIHSPFTCRGLLNAFKKKVKHVQMREHTYIEGKIYSRTDIISDRRLQRSKYGSNCARSSGQQDMLALG